MNAILFITCLLGQTQLPHELDKTTHYLRELSYGERIRASADALAVDEFGRVWLKGHWQFSYDERPYTRSIEIICTRMGYAVRVHPIYQGDRYTTPRWERNYEPRPWDIPVRSIIILEPPHPRPSLFSRLDRYYQNPVGPPPE